MDMKIVLTDYLKKIKAEEKAKPLGQRRHIPTQTEIAEMAGVTKQAFSEIVNNNTVAVNRFALAASIKALRDCGFDTDFNDVLTYTDD